MDFEIRKDRRSQGRKKLVREGAAYFRLMQEVSSSKEACRIVGIDVRTGKKWRNGSHATNGGRVVWGATEGGRHARDGRVHGESR